MKVINLNSKFDLTAAQIDFAESVMTNFACIDRFPDESIDFSFFIKSIPVYLLDEQTMKTWERKNEREYFNDFDSERPSIEWLGFYCPNCSVLGVTHPAIALCPERIEQCSSDDTELCWIVAMTLIHEFGHAFMDVSHYGHYDEFHDWIEEPMANFITLHVAKCVCFAKPSFSKYTWYVNSKYLTKNNSIFDVDAFYKFVEDFIKHQPDNYRIGAYMFNKGYFDLYNVVNWSRMKSEWSGLTWQKRLWLDYWKSVVNGKCQYEDVVAYNIWRSFENVNYRRFKELLKYFKNVLTDASQGSFVFDDQIQEDMRFLSSYLYGDFKLILDGSDWKNSYIYWECKRKDNEVIIYPRFDSCGNLYAFEFIDFVSKKNILLKCNNVGLDEDGEPSQFIKMFLDAFTESAIRSIF